MRLLIITSGNPWKSSQVKRSVPLTSIVLILGRHCGVILIALVFGARRTSRSADFIFSPTSSHIIFFTILLHRTMLPCTVQTLSSSQLTLANEHIITSRVPGDRGGRQG